MALNNTNAKHATTDTSLTILHASPNVQSINTLMYTVIATGAILPASIALVQRTSSVQNVTMIDLSIGLSVMSIAVHLQLTLQSQASESVKIVHMDVQYVPQLQLVTNVLEGSI